MLHGCPPRASPGITGRARVAEATWGCLGPTGGSISHLLLGKGASCMSHTAFLVLDRLIWRSSRSHITRNPACDGVGRQASIYTPRPGTKRPWACLCCISHVPREPAPGSTNHPKTRGAEPADLSCPPFYSTRGNMGNLTVFLLVR